MPEKHMRSLKSFKTGKNSQRWYYKKGIGNENYFSILQKFAG